MIAFHNKIMYEYHTLTLAYAGWIILDKLIFNEYVYLRFLSHKISPYLLYLKTDFNKIFNRITALNFFFPVATIAVTFLLFLNQKAYGKDQQMNQV